MGKMVTPWLVVLLLWSTFALPTFANTEIINFKTTPGARLSQDLSLGKRIQEDVLIPGQSVRVSVPQAELATIEGRESLVTKHFRIALDQYLQNQSRSDIRPWLCKTFLGGCDVASDKAWTARISWPATTPSEFKIFVMEDVPGSDISKGSHDRIIKVQVERAGAAVPPFAPLQIFSRKSTAELRNVTAEQASGGDLPQVTVDGLEEPLVFDLVVEPLLFGVLPLGSLETAVTVILAVLIGSVLAGGFFKFVPI